MTQTQIQTPKPAQTGETTTPTSLQRPEITDALQVPPQPLTLAQRLQAMKDKLDRGECVCGRTPEECVMRCKK